LEQVIKFVLLVPAREDMNALSVKEPEEMDLCSAITKENILGQYGIGAKNICPTT
jgi:hypothetical protein